MVPIQKSPIPANTFLASYSIAGGYVDCYCTEIPGQISFSEYIRSFYTTLLFRLERLLLKLAVSKPSTDKEAENLADGDINMFAAWRVEKRTENELLMCDFRGRTRSWLMVTPVNTAYRARTRLYFGSIIVPVRNPKTGEMSLGPVFQALLGFHKIYSILLLFSAARNVKHHDSRIS